MRLLTAPTVLTALAAVLAAQQPQLLLPQRSLSQPLGASLVAWQLAAAPGAIHALLLDIAPGPTQVFGAAFDLGFGPSLAIATFGVVGPSGAASGSLALPIATFPTNLPILVQSGSWDPALGLTALRASNLDAFVVHGENDALAFDFTNPAQPTFGMTGVFDTTVRHRLQARPPLVRTVNPLPPEAMPWPFTTVLTPFQPNGARFQHALRASELGSIGVPERVTAVRWRPLFGNVTPQTLPQFELRAALTDVVPDYTIDPWSLLPVAPGSGLASAFAANPAAGTEQVLFSGAYTITPQALSANGYLPFPLAQPFVHDGVRTLLLETRCTASASSASNFPLIHLLSQSGPQPYATMAAVGGWNGFPLPLVPTATTTGAGGSYLFDVEVELQRTHSVAESPWTPANTSVPDWQAATRVQATPAGTTLVVEYRGRAHATATPTAWSATPDVADGLQQLQFRVTMEANAVSGAVPWLDLLVIPYR